MTRARHIALTLAATLAAPSAFGAPMGPGVEPARVLSFFHADREREVAAKAMVNALRQRVLDSDEFALNAFSATLGETAHEAKCSLTWLIGPAPVAHEGSFDAACLKRMGARLGVKHFFWGLVYAEGTTTFVRLHLWQEGEGDRAATLPYDAAHRDRVADRLYRKLVTPDKVGDVTVSGQAQGELFIDGQSAGPYVAGVELTLPVGDRELEVRQGSRVAARGRASITPGGHTEARLELVVEPAPSPPPTGPVISPPATVRSKASAWPWVLGGTAAAGLAGAGAFYALRSSELRDLEAACLGRACLSGQTSAVDRAELYGTLSAFSLGVGVAAGAGLITYLFVAKREPKVVGGFVPVAGGAAVGLGGIF